MVVMMFGSQEAVDNVELKITLKQDNEDDMVGKYNYWSGQAEI